MTDSSEASAELFRLIAEYTYDWETWVDAQGVTRWVNEAVYRITGYSVEECLARRDYPLWLAVEGDRRLLQGVLADAASGGSGNDVEFKILTKRGEERWVAISFQAVRSQRDQPLGYRTSVRDIDQRKRAEEELRILRQRAEALTLARTELLANVSHELRSPVHCIAGFAELLMQEPLTAGQHRYVELIADQSESMLRQVEDLLSLSALDAGGMQLLSEPVDLAELSRGLIEGSAQDAKQRGLTLAARLSLRDQWVVGDAHRLKQVIRNLLDNALKFTERGSVELVFADEGEEPDRWLVIEVIDTGLGMDEAQIESLLLPFRQADAGSNRRRSGVGLGLSIVERLVRAMGGQLWIHSRLNQGTRVQVRLPFVKARAPEPRAAGMGSKENVATGRALVVDDSAPARELLCEMLRLCGFSSLAVASAEAAELAVQTERFDVVFLDYQMPGKDGAETASALRRGLDAQATHLRAPIYLLTANVFVHERLRAEEGPIDGILLKPLNRAALSALLASVPDRGERDVPHAASSGESAMLDAELVGELRTMRAQGGQTMLEKLLPQVERDMRDALAQARAALSERDAARLKRLAHSAAGHAAVLGALGARDVARELETLLEREPDALARAGPLIARCEEAFQRALSQLRS